MWTVLYLESVCHIVGFTVSGFLSEMQAFTSFHLPSTEMLNLHFHYSEQKDDSQDGPTFSSL